MEPKDFLGLVAAVGIKLTPELLPSIVLETDKSIAFQHPNPEAKTHIVVVPKRDSKHAADLTADDRDFLADAYAVMGQIIRDQQMEQYRIITNGPGYQNVTYLHFHLLSKDE
ncbi:HIT domain-containing protein [Candidatus Berkelbacteria bacterium]|nr:HIT domain-containing protein [Candidatus Berkelbacteria bacterium]